MEPRPKHLFTMPPRSTGLRCQAPKVGWSRHTQDHRAGKLRTRVSATLREGNKRISLKAHPIPADITTYQKLIGTTGRSRLLPGLGNKQKLTRRSQWAGHLRPQRQARPT